MTQFRKGVNHIVDPQSTHDPAQGPPHRHVEGRVGAHRIEGIVAWNLKGHKKPRLGNRKPILRPSQLLNTMMPKPTQQAEE
jgi:hypothetical protein